MDERRCESNEQRLNRTEVRTLERYCAGTIEEWAVTVALCLRLREGNRRGREPTHVRLYQKLRLPEEPGSYRTALRFPRGCGAVGEARKARKAHGAALGVPV